MALSTCALRGDDVSNDVEAIEDELGKCDRFGFAGINLLISARNPDFCGIPIIAKFNSGHKYVEKPMLGSGWWFPLIESSVIQIRESAIMVNMPDGSHRYLYLSPNESDLFESRNFDLSAKIVGDKFLLKKRDGTQYKYVKGRLDEIILPNGHSISWQYNKDAILVVGIEGRTFRATKTADGLLKSLSLNDEKPLAFDYQIAPDIVSTPLGNKIVSASKSLCSVVDNGLSGNKIEITTDEAFETAFLREYRAGLMVESLSWALPSGKILSDAISSYEIKGESVGSRSILRRFKDGTSESIMFNGHTGVVEFCNRSGNRDRVYSITTPGPSYGLTRKLVRLEGSGNERIQVNSYFDINGAYLRKSMLKPWGSDEFAQSNGVPSLRPKVTNEEYEKRETEAYVEVWRKMSKAPLVQYSKTEPTVKKNLGSQYWNVFVLTNEGTLNLVKTVYLTSEK